MQHATQNQQQDSTTTAADWQQQAAVILDYVDQNAAVIRAEMTAMNIKAAMLYGASLMFRDRPTPGLAGWLKLHFDRYAAQAQESL